MMVDCSSVGDIKDLKCKESSNFFSLFPVITPLPTTVEFVLASPSMLSAHCEKKLISPPHYKDNICRPAVAFHNMKQKHETGIEAPIARFDDLGHKPTG